MRAFAGMFLSLVLCGGAVGQTGSINTIQYASRPMFDTDNPGLTLENFESGVVPADDVVTFTEPLDSSTSNSAFPTGIEDGLTISAGAVPGNNLALVGPEFFSVGVPGSQVLGADTFTDNTTLTFQPDVFAVGLDIFDDGDVSILAFDASLNLIDSATIAAIETGTFLESQPIWPSIRLSLWNLAIWMAS